MLITDHNVREREITDRAYIVHDRCDFSRRNSGRAAGG